MRITKEWAKQLAYEVWGELDYAEMVVSYTSNRIQTVTVAILDENLIYSKAASASAFPVTIDYDEITMEYISDHVNEEITQLGYSKKANTLMVGETIPFPNEYNTMTRLP